MAANGFVIPSSYFGNTDQDTAQLVALAQDAALDIIENDFQFQRKQGSVTTHAGTTTYPLPTDFLAFAPNTLFQFGRWDMVDLSTTPETWALLHSVTAVASLPIRARILQGQLNVLNPTEGATINFEYVTNTTIRLASNPFSTSSTFQADGDTWQLDDRLFQAEVTWRWRRAKGFQDWQTYLQEAAARRNSVKGRDAGNSTIVPQQVTITGQPYTNLWAPPNA
jgi:hypothetical protein